jgi:hypothetical protein
MKPLQRIPTWAAVVLMSLLVSCALPMSSTPTQFIFPTPNLTMTALFQIPPTSTTAPQATQAGATNTPATTLVPTAANCTNVAQLVSETIPDLSYIAPGSAFIKTWTMKNTGTCTWGAGYALVFDSGDQMGGPATVPITASVPPNALYTFTVNLTAPATAGQFKGNWMIQTPQNTKFGVTGTSYTSPFWVQITTVVLPPPCNAQNKRPDANGPMVEAYQTITPPTIDGDLSEWTVPLIDSITNKVFGTTSNTATYTLKWDADYLYLAIQVVDDTFMQGSTGFADIYKGDSVEILLDTNLKGDYCDTSMSSDDFQLGIQPGSLPTVGAPNPSAYLWYPLSQAGTKIVNIAGQIIVGGWQMEARIPWNVFGIAPGGSEIYGFAMSVSDDDHAGLVQQDGMISSDPKRTYPTNPTLWGTLQMEIKTGP